MADTMEVVKHLRSRLGHIWEDVCDLIIRPPRCTYRPSALGPKLFRTSTTSKACFEREDLVLRNMRDMKLECSWYRPADIDAYERYLAAQRRGVPPDEAADEIVGKLSQHRGRTPCVVYLHGNCGSRLDARDCLFLLEEGISVFAVDLSGSGLSEGEYVSLGFFERQDLAAIVDHLHMSKMVSTIGLWGRSMGAVTAIMYAARDPSISAIVCDSPFSSLELLAKDLAMLHASWVPGFAVDGVVNKIRRLVMRRAGFSIDDLDTLKYARMCQRAPAFIFHGEDDDFVRYEHSQAVADHYAGNCIHHVVKGDHNSTRKNDVRDVARAFLRLYLIEKPQAAVSPSGGHPPSATLLTPPRTPQAVESDGDGVEADESSLSPPPAGARGDGNDHASRDDGAEAAADESDGDASIL